MNDTIFKNKSYWKNMTKDELDKYIDEIFIHYRDIGFPYYPTDEEYRRKEFEKLKNFDRSNIIKDGIINQSMHGLGLAWSYFQHAFDVKSNNKMSPFEAFMDNDILKKVIRKRLKMGTYISDAGIRKMLKIYTGVQGVSNFRPTAAAAIYDKYAGDGYVWDMSGGWGGRFLGAIISDRVKSYIATEPATLTYLGLNQIGFDFADENNTRWGIIRKGSEEYIPDKDSLDLCFTSPPYFNLEKYSGENTQSYKKFPIIDYWVDSFLKKTMENCFFGLKKDKYMIINIADKKGKNNLQLEEKTIILAEEIGFKHIDTLKYALSNVNLKNKQNKYKYEPVFIFKK